MTTGAKCVQACPGNRAACWSILQHSVRRFMMVAPGTPGAVWRKPGLTLASSGSRKKGWSAFHCSSQRPHDNGAGHCHYLCPDVTGIGSCRDSARARTVRVRSRAVTAGYWTGVAALLPESLAKRVAWKRVAAQWRCMRGSWWG